MTKPTDIDGAACDRLDALVSCVGCKYLYAEGSGYSNYSWEATYVRCAKDRNHNLADGDAEAPCDWNKKAAMDNWPMTNESRCELFASGVFIKLDVDGYNGPADKSQARNRLRLFANILAVIATVKMTANDLSAGLGAELKRRTGRSERRRAGTAGCFC